VKPQSRYHEKRLKNCTISAKDLENKHIGDDTKAGACQSPDCIKRTKKYVPIQIASQFNDTD